MIQDEPNQNLRDAAENGNLLLVQKLIQDGANIHARRDESLQIAAKGHLPVVEFLIKNGADIHVEEDDPLRWAATNGHPPIVKFLVANGANVNAGNTRALRWAALNGHLSVVEFLVVNGADLAVAGMYGGDIVYDWVQTYTHSKNLNNKLQIDLNTDSNSDDIRLRKKI